MKIKTVKLGRYASLNKVKWFLAIYCGILVLSVVINAVIPQENFLSPDPEEQSLIEDAQKAALLFYNAVRENRLDRTEGVYANKEWSFKYNGQKLEIIEGMENSRIEIVISSKDADDGVVEVTHYTTKSIFYGLDFTEEIMLPEIQLTGEKLSIINPGKQTFEFAKFVRDFSTAQFLGGGFNSEEYRFNMVQGRRVLYLSIPQNLQIVANNSNILYIENNKR